MGASSFYEGKEDYVGLKAHFQANMFLRDPNSPGWTSVNSMNFRN